MKKLTTILLLTLMALCFTGCGDTYEIRTLRQKVVDGNQKIENLENEISELNAQVTKLMDERDSIEIDLQRAEEKLANYENNTSSAKDTVSSLRAENENLRAELSKKEAAIAATKQTPAPIILNVDSTQAANYVALTFYPDPDGKRFSAKNKWYSSPLCSDTDEIKGNVVMISDVVKTEKLNNGFKFYSCMSTNGLVFAREKPYLKETDAK